MQKEEQDKKQTEKTSLFGTAASLADDQSDAILGNFFDDFLAVSHYRERRETEGNRG